MRFHLFLGVFPYDFAESYDILEKTFQLPTKEQFFNKLTDSQISDSDYEHALNVFKKFEITNMLEYNNLYMKLDTFLLADVFLNFRNAMFDKFKLDACNYVSLPTFSYDCMLKLTKVEIEQISDIDMYLMMTQNIRGGLSFIGQRMENAEEEENPRTMLYYDANNL